MAKEDKDYCIYMHRNKINNKIYVGQSHCIKTRWYPICYKGSRYFYGAIEKYGWENFEHKIIEANLSKEEADIREKYWIQQFDSCNREFGYNLRIGGNNGYLHSEETKNKIKQSNKIYWQTEEGQRKGKYIIQKANEGARKSVICINTGQVFSSLTEAAKYAGLKHPTPIHRCCTGERLTAGKHPKTDERLSWQYYNKDKKEHKNNE